MSLRVEPTTASVANGKTQQFKAIKMTPGGPSTGEPGNVSWAVSGSGNGTVDEKGLYTAPASGNGTATVTASDKTDGATASASVKFGATI